MRTLDSIDRRAAHEKHTTVIIVHCFMGVFLFERVAYFTLGSIRCFQTYSLRSECRIDRCLTYIVNSKVYRTGICLEQLVPDSFRLP